jgi:hypothetical protein
MDDLQKEFTSFNRLELGVQDTLALCALIAIMFYAQQFPWAGTAQSV